MRVPLTKGYVALVDWEDVALVSAHSWHAHENRPGHVYAACGVMRDGRQVTVRMHRLLLRAEAGQIVDHINGNQLDNRRANLRLTDPTGNARNGGRKRTGDTQSRYKGVSRSCRPRTKPWMAAITADNRRRTIGTYRTEEEAARAYDARAIELHGAFARTNVDLGLLPPA